MRTLPASSGRSGVADFGLSTSTNPHILSLQSIRIEVAIHFDGKETLTHDLHLGQRMCLSIIDFNGLTSTITRESCGFAFFFDEDVEQEEGVVNADGVVDDVVKNRLHLDGGSPDAGLTSSTPSSLLCKLVVGEGSLANGTLLPRVLLVTAHPLPANLLLGDDSSFLCSAVAVARHLDGLIAFKLGDVMV